MKRILHNLKIPFTVAMISVFGALLNILISSINHGMPVMGLTYSYDRWIPMTETTKLNILGDFIPIPDGSASIGDFIMLLSIIVYILWAIKFFYKGWNESRELNKINKLSKTIQIDD